MVASSGRYPWLFNTGDAESKTLTKTFSHEFHSGTENEIVSFLEERTLKRQLFAIEVTEGNLTSVVVRSNKVGLYYFEK